MTFENSQNYRRKAGVYIIRSVIDSRVYVGSSMNLYRRFCDHRASLIRGNHRSPKLQAFSDKYGIETLNFSVLEVVDDSNQLIEREQFYIDHFQSFARSKGFNTSPTAGSALGVRHTAETKLAKSGKNSVHYGKRGAEAPAFGHRHDKETKRIISEAARKYRTGITLSDSTKQKLRDINLGKKHSEYTKELCRQLSSRANNPCAKKVINTQTGEVFGCLRDAAESIGVSYPSVRKWMSGYRKNKSSLAYL
jgi:group I intron endonuclease